MIGFGFSVFTQAILGLGGGFRGSALNLDFTSGNRTLDRRVTFSRTTNATLTNSAGLVANAPMNLLTFSEQFDNAAWLKTGSTVTANSSVAPDGTTTADKLIEDTGNTEHRLRVVTISKPASAVMTYSVYVKPVGRYFVLSMEQGGLGLYTNFDVSTNQYWDYAADTGWTRGQTVITSVGNGWYRCSISGTTDTNTTVNIRVNLSNATGLQKSPTYTGDGTSGAFVWGAQLELGSTATTYNPTTVKNLLGYTEHFDNAAWTKSNASISATKVDDIYGQPFAQKLVENTATTSHFVFQGLTTTGPYTVSMFAKSAERSTFAIRYYIAANNWVTVVFNLATGVVSRTSNGSGSTLTGVTPTIQSVGNGWYRCSLTATGTAIVNAIFMLTSSATPTLQATDGTEIYLGDGTSGIYIFGAQLSDSASVDPYVYNPVEAPTSTAYYGPRFDYDPVTLAPKGLLIEEQRTNLALYSQAITATNIWQSLNSAVVTGNTSNGADGTLSASRIDFTANASSCIYRNAPQTTGTWTFSAWMSSTTAKNARLIIFNSSGSTATANITLTPTLTRYSITTTGTDVTNVGFINSSLADAGSITVWGAQLEAGAFATSYIPTVASQVTRAADSASMIGNNFARWYNATEGTLFSDFDWLGLTSNDYCFSIGTDGNNSIGLGVNTSGLSRFLVVSGGAAQASYSFSAVTANVPVKLAGAYKLNDFNAAAAGVAGTTDTSGTVPLATSAQFNSSIGGGNDFNGHLKRIAYYPRRLTNAELQGITS